MSEQLSELIEISKLNGDFKRNYGKFVGACSISAARGRSFFWSGLIVAAFSALPLLGKLGCVRQLFP